MKKMLCMIMVVIFLSVTVSCSKQKQETSDTGKTQTVEDQKEADEWKEKIHQAIHQSEYKPSTQDLLEEMETDDFYDLVAGEKLPSKRDSYQRNGEEYYVMGADFTNLRERIPGSYKRYFHYALDEKGNKETYLGAYYIHMGNKKIYFEDLRGDIIDFETGQEVTNIDYETDPLTKYPKRDITSENAAEETMKILEYLMIIDDRKNYEASVERPSWKSGEEPEWWDEADEVYRGHFSVVVRSKKNPEEIEGYYILREDGCQLQQYSKKNQSYHLIYGTRISTISDFGQEEESGGVSGKEEKTLPKTISEEDLMHTAVAVISGLFEDDANGVPIHPELRPFRKPKHKETYVPENMDVYNTVILISANDKTQIELLEVLGWSEETNSLMTGKEIFRGTFDRGEYLRVDCVEAETMPDLLARIIAEDEHTETFYNFGYDGEGSHTKNGITKWIQIYGEDEDIWSKESKLIDYLTDLALGKK